MPNNNVQTLLLGGGYVLKKLSELLPKASFVITSRSERTCSHFEKKGLETFCTDIEDAQSLAELFRQYPKITTVIDSVPPRGEYTGTETLLSVLKNTKVKRIFYLSTTGVYGVADGSWVYESTPCEPITDSGKSRVAVEQSYLSSPYEVTLFRLSGIYGPGRGLGVALKKGSYRQLDDGSRYTNRIHVEDISHILKEALKTSSKLPDSLNINDDYPAPMHEVIKYYQERFSVPAPSVVSTEEIKASGGGRLLQNQRVANHLVKETLKYSFLYPTYREGAGTEFEDG